MAYKSACVIKLTMSSLEQGLHLPIGVHEQEPAIAQSGTSPEGDGVKGQLKERRPEVPHTPPSHRGITYQVPPKSPIRNRVQRIKVHFKTCPYSHGQTVCPLPLFREKKKSGDVTKLYHGHFNYYNVN